MDQVTVPRELLRQAIEALASAYVSSTVITELRTALEQPAVKPTYQRLNEDRDNGCKIFDQFAFFKQVHGFTPPQARTSTDVQQQPVPVEPSTALRELACKYITEDEASESSINRLLTIGRKMADSISAAPQVQPAVEPVAWRYRITNKALSWAGAWSYSEVDPAHSLESESEVEPLYTAPQVQPAVEPEKTNAKESNADVDFCSNAAINEQRRNMVGEVEVGQSLGNGQHQSTGNSEPQGAVAVITGFDEYGPFLSWHTHWVNLPVGAKLYAAPQAQQPFGWLRAVDEEMVSTHLGVADITDSYEDAKRKLNALICWHVDVSHDPKVNGSAQQPTPVQEKS